LAALGFVGDSELALDEGLSAASSLLGEGGNKCGKKLVFGELPTTGETGCKSVFNGIFAVDCHPPVTEVTSN
jgi:hypothetical protein